LQLVGGGNATVLGTVTILSGLCAFLTNGAIAYAPILLGREEMTNKFIWTKGVVTNLIFIVIASVIGILFGYMF
jgi:di/tricarboxylate transporter